MLLGNKVGRIRKTPKSRLGSRRQLGKVFGGILFELIHAHGAAEADFSSLIVHHNGLSHFPQLLSGNHAGGQGIGSSCCINHDFGWFFYDRALGKTAECSHDKASAYKAESHGNNGEILHWEIIMPLLDGDE